MALTGARGLVVSPGARMLVRPLAGAVGRGRLPNLSELLAPLGLGLVTLLVFWNDLASGITYYGGDTVSFYYPLTTWYAERLREGRLPLWFPYIYGGYPLFADGEVGMLYPLHLLAYALLPADVAFVWLRPLHFWLAGLFTYWLGRLLGLSRFGALIGGLTFSYGSFLVSHLQHENIIRGAVWLPLAIGLLELALRARGRRRVGWLLGCGVVVGIQLLGVHVQPVLLTLLALGSYALAGPLRGRGGGGQAPALGERGSRRVAAYLGSRGLAIGLVTVVGLGLAAVQVLPLYQLGQRSLRGEGVSYEFSTSYSVPPLQLLQLLLPYLFRPDQVNYWGLWSAIETTVYLGVAPLLLALIGLAYLRSRPIAFFGLLGGGSLLLALGDYLPIKLYSLIWSLPGFSVLRVPARFSFLFVLAGAVLAGLGADWLASRAFDRPSGRARPRVRRLALLGTSFGLAALGLAASFLLVRAWLDLDPGGTRQAIEAHYLSLRRGDLSLTASGVYHGLLRSLDLGNPRTLGGLALMVAASGWLLLRGLHSVPRRVWQGGLLALVVLDLVSFAQGFNSKQAVADLKPAAPAAQFLAQHNGLHRVLVEPLLYPLLGPNRLVGDSIHLAGGYSSLEPRQATEYWWSLVRQDNVLLDLYNVRYVLTPNHVPGMASFEGVLYHPGDRLMRGAVGNPSGTETFRFEPWWTESLSLVAAGEGLGEVPFGEPLAEIVVRGAAGERRVVLRAGQDVGDGAAPLLGPPMPGPNRRARPVWTGASFQNPGQVSVLYGTTLKLDQPLLATEVTIQRVGPSGPLNVYGLGLHDRPGLPVRSLMPSDRAKYRLVYEDWDLKILENRAAFPRAFLVGGGLAADDARGSLVERMLVGAFDPRRTILIQGGPGQRFDGGSASAEVGSAEIVEYADERVRVRVDAREAGYLVLGDRYEDGWRARIDGREATLLRADAVFRAVAVEAGQHEVVFSYEPWSVRLGLGVSLLSLALVAIGFVFCLRR